MRQEHYETVACQLLTTANDIETAKRPGYTMGNVDVFHNFKSVAQRVGITTEQAWAVYFLKHVDAIISGMCKPELPVAEAMEGRFADAVNYLKLGWGILQERTAAEMEPMTEPSYGGLGIFNSPEWQWRPEVTTMGYVDPRTPVTSGYVAPVVTTTATWNGKLQADLEKLYKLKAEAEAADSKAAYNSGWGMTTTGIG